jgi:hypothetical protein
MWIVYSRATTSAMAERVAFPEGFVDDILRGLSAGAAEAIAQKIVSDRVETWTEAAITYFEVWVAITRGR